MDCCCIGLLSLRVLNGCCGLFCGLAVGCGVLTIVVSWVWCVIGFLVFGFPELGNLVVWVLDGCRLHSGWCVLDWWGASFRESGVFCCLG